MTVDEVKQEIKEIQQQIEVAEHPMEKMMLETYKLTPLLIVYAKLKLGIL
jgi:hypothetical protein